MLTTAFALFFMAFPVPPDPLADLGRFPSLDYCRATVDFSCAFESGLAAKKGFTPRYYFEYSAAAAEVQRRRLAWNDLDYAINPAFVREVRLKSLAELRTAIGEEDFWAGRMPCPVPLWACEGGQ